MPRTREQEVAAYRYLRPVQIAEQLGCSPSHVLNLIRDGKLAAIDIGTGRRPEYRVAPDALGAFLRRRATAA